MNRIPRTPLPILGAALLATACATGGAPGLDADANKAAMRADRQSVALSVHASEEAREAARYAQRGLTALRAAASTDDPGRRQANAREAARYAAIAGDYSARSDDLTGLATARTSGNLALERMLEEQIRYRKAHPRYAPSLMDLDLRFPELDVRVLSADADGFAAVAFDADAACLMRVADAADPAEAEPEVVCTTG